MTMMFCSGFQEKNTIKVKKKKRKYLKKKMINPKYLSPEIKDKLNRLSLELCEYRYTSKFKKRYSFEMDRNCRSKNSLY